MRPISLAYTLITSCLVLSASAQLVPFSSFLKQRKAAAPDHQSPLMDAPNIALPPSGDGRPAPDSSSGVLISDIIGSNRNIGIFSGFTRDIDTVAKRLEDSSQNATVLAPENSAIMALPRKPWEDPRDYDTFGASAYDGSEGEDRAHRNLRRFVEAHIVPESPWRESKKVQTLAGNTVWYESKDGKKIIQPGDVEVVSVADKVANGEVWVIKGVLDKP